MKLFIEESLTKSTLDWVLNESNRESYLNKNGEFARYHNFFIKNKDLILSPIITFPPLDGFCNIILNLILILPFRLSVLVGFNLKPLL